MLEFAEKIRKISIRKMPLKFSFREIIVEPEDVIPILDRIESGERKIPTEEECDFYCTMRKKMIVEFLDGVGKELGKLELCGELMKYQEEIFLIEENGKFINYAEMMDYLFETHRARDTEELENAKLICKAMTKGQTSILYCDWSAEDSEKNNGKVHRKILEEV